MFNKLIRDLKTSDYQRDTVLKFEVEKSNLVPHDLYLMATEITEDITDIPLQYQCYIAGLVEYLCGLLSQRYPEHLEPLRDLKVTIEDLDVYRDLLPTQGKIGATKMVQILLDGSEPAFSSRGIPKVSVILKES